MKATEIQIGWDVRTAEPITMTTNELFAIRQDPHNPRNWGIIWERSGTEGGYTSDEAARKSAVDQNGLEAAEQDSNTWDW